MGGTLCVALVALGGVAVGTSLCGSVRGRATVWEAV